MKDLPNISLWTEEDLREIPSSETDLFEYKSSKNPLDNLKNKISVAASAFWNSGGGIFIAGVNDNGEIDGGIEKHSCQVIIRQMSGIVIRIAHLIPPSTSRIMFSGESFSSSRYSQVFSDRLMVFPAALLLRKSLHLLAAIVHIQPLRFLPSNFAIFL